MRGATKTGDNKWEGDLLDAETGKTYSGVATLESPGALKSQRMRHGHSLQGRNLDQGEVTAAGGSPLPKYPLTNSI